MLSLTYKIRINNIYDTRVIESNTFIDGIDARKRFFCYIWILWNKFYYVKCIASYATLNEIAYESFIFNLVELYHPTSIFMQI